MKDTMTGKCGLSHEPLANKRMSYVPHINKLAVSLRKEQWLLKF